MSASANHYDFLISRIKDYIEVNDAEIEIIHRLFVEEQYSVFLNIISHRTSG